ncbi:MAG TPA: SMC-Scp complex subunit ScpB [bacterium]
MNESDAKKIIEAVLFASSEVMTVKQLRGVLGNPSPDGLEALIAELNGEYESSGRTFRITEIGDGYQMRTLPMYKTWIQKAEPLKPTRLSPAMLEIMAIVAYRQPVTRGEVEHLRGVDCSYGLRSLLEKKLVRIVGKDPGPGRAVLYATSKEFLSLFNLADLKDLPTLEDFDLPANPEEQPALPMDVVPQVQESA